MDRVVGWLPSAGEVGQWFKDYASALSAVAAVILVLVTIRYTRLTYRLSVAAGDQLEEARRARLDGQMPTVGVNANAHKLNQRPHLVRVNVRLRNHGTIPANVALEPPNDWILHQRSSVDAPHVYLTLSPAATTDVAYQAPVDPDGSSQLLTAWVTVTPMHGGAADEYAVSVTYDPSTDPPTVEGGAIHERRTYRPAEPGQSPRRRWRRSAGVRASARRES